jgi:hypothetical protein
MEDRMSIIRTTTSYLKKNDKLFISMCLFYILYSMASSFFPSTRLNALPNRIKINSVKSLTYILSSVEKEIGNEARYVTLKLQIYLEDIYISQGTSIIFKPRSLSLAIKNLLQEGKSKKIIAQEILQRYKNGEFHD